MRPVGQAGENNIKNQNEKRKNDERGGHMGSPVRSPGEQGLCTWPRLLGPCLQLTGIRIRAGRFQTTEFQTKDDKKMANLKTQIRKWPQKVM